VSKRHTLSSGSSAGPQVVSGSSLGRLVPRRDALAWRRSVSSATSGPPGSSMFRLADHGNNPRFKTKPVRPSRSVRTGDRSLLSRAGRSSTSSPPALSPWHTPTLHAGPTPLGFPPLSTATATHRNDRIINFRKGPGERARVLLRALASAGTAGGPRSPNRPPQEKRELPIPIPSFLPFTRLSFGDTIALFDPSSRPPRGSLL